MFLLFGRNPLVTGIVILAGVALLAFGIDRGKILMIVLGVILVGRGGLNLAGYWRRHDRAGRR
ncbi:hypothetical protein [Rugosimonospora africana]|uniref:Uncharacterized protein n=1 Tax=Rugosimonospora africana TaxID=556532 RepID=A0A8J3VR55_9ACTN|nr:hypothetical protein [Rugosimonospora africana]GIH15774.1 hypothetical protein Raf01_39460 [Rugosimonospora africana]